MDKDQENDLYRKVLEARARWLKEIKSRGVIGKRSVTESAHELGEEIPGNKQKEDNFYMQGDSDRSQKKILYLVTPEIWSEVASDEMDFLKAELDQEKERGHKLPRKVWLPTVIKNAEEVFAKSYEAKSVKKVTLKAARRFALKAGLDKKTMDKFLIDENEEFWTSTITGRKYKLKVTDSYTYESKIYPFTDWAVCLCTKDSIPSLKKRDKIQKKTLEDHSKKILCTHGNVTLFVKNYKM